MIRTFTGYFLFLVLCLGGHAKEVMPPAPARHFNDQAGLVSASVARQLDRELAQLERDTSNQVLVAIYPHMQSDSSIEDYTQRVAQSWHAGTKGRNNGAVLFIFSQDHKLYIQTGYGLESVLPDALCKRIVNDVIVPRFRQGDYSGGVSAGVQTLIAATKGEFKGTGRTLGEKDRRHSFNPFSIIFVLLIIASAVGSSRRRSVYGRSGRSTIWFGGGGGGWGGGGSSGGFGGGGGFSGGGGSFGGGGAGGSW